MVRNEKVYQQAVEFRKRGFTYSEIARICGISKSTASSWLSHKAFSKRVRKDNAERAARDNAKRMSLLNKSRASERTARYQDALKSAETEYKHYKADPLFTSALVLYSVCGDESKSNVIRITSAKTDVHRIFIKFATEYLGVTKESIHFWMLLYPEHNEAACFKKWSRALSLSKTQFYKTQVVAGRHNRPALHHGVGNTIIGSTVLKRKLLYWVERASKEL